MNANAKQKTKTMLPELISKHEADLAAEWGDVQRSTLGVKLADVEQRRINDETRRFLKLFVAGAASGAFDIQADAWREVRALLGEISRARAEHGYSPSETATFIFSLKQPLFDRLRDELIKEPERLADEIWVATLLLDSLGLYTTEIFQKTREDLILRQQQAMLELSTPVIRLWDSVLAVPLIGTLDSNRTQVVMETLLERIVESSAAIAIIDITGVPIVDTLVAQHLLKTIAAARLMGADCIISGIRPQIAQTIVHLGVDLGDVVTKATLADAFRIALSRLNPTLAAALKAAAT
jgi:rsbT co-antagonist protein RsbR